jgi:hypothetical protein
VLFTLFGVAIRTLRRFFLVTKTNPSTAESDDPVPLIASLAATSLLTAATGGHGATGILGIAET